MNFNYILSDGSKEFNNFVIYIEKFKIKLPEKAKNCLDIINKLFQSKNKFKNLDLDYYLVIKDHHEFIGDFVYMSKNYYLESLWQKYTDTAYNYRNLIKSLESESCIDFFIKSNYSQIKKSKNEQESSSHIALLISEYQRSRKYFTNHV
jgi:hypothetical protein